MSTAVATISSTTGAVDFRKEMNVIHDIVAECENEISLMNQVHDFVYSSDRVSMINRLQVLSRRPNDENFRNVSQLNAVNLDFVKQNIWAEYWHKVTDIRSEDVAGRVGVLIGEGYREGSFDFSISDEPMSVAWNCTMAETSE